MRTRPRSHLLLLATGMLAAPPLRSQAVPELIERACCECHSGWDAEQGFDLAALFAPGAAAAPDYTERLERAARRIRGRTMPPPDDGEPLADGERERMLQLLAERAPLVPGARVATIRRLTRRQYEHSIEALFGIRWRARDLLPDDASAHGFVGIGDVQNASPLLFEKYLDAATDVADAVLADDDARTRWFGGERALADWLPELLARTFRRPVDEQEVADYAADYLLLQRGDAHPRTAQHALLRSLLASPNFLFRAESGRRDDTATLTAHELASRLSFLTTSGPPDAELRARADDGSLTRPDVLAAQALRLARQRDGRGLADDFAAQWFALDDVLVATADFRRFPAIWNRSLRPSMRAEVVRLFAHIVHEDRSVLELLDADYAFVDETLARHYGLPAPAGGGFARVTLPDRRRGGVLGSGAMLMTTSYPLRTSPVKRGQWILTRLFDAPPPPPPADAGTLPKDDKNRSGLTLRQQLERHRREARCAACHAEMDALGFALEPYDPLGRWRDEVHGKPVDATAELPDGTGIDGPIALKDALLQRRDDFVRAFARNLLVLGVGRDMQLRDEPELLRIVRSTREGGYRFAALWTAVVRSPLFTSRDPDQQR